MPLRESEAIVLRSFPMGEADRLVSFFSRSSGRLRGVARGARRVKSQFGSTLETLAYVRVWFYERETRDLVRISQCELIESFHQAQRDYASTLALALISEVTEAVLPEREAADPVFRLILLTARAIAAGRGIWPPLAYFGLWSVRLAGWLPGLDRCQNCGSDFSVKRVYEMDAGELVCGDCRIGGRELNRDMLVLGQKMLRGKPNETLEVREQQLLLKELVRFALDIVERHIEKRLSSWKLLLAEGS
jgi:DNA repair protein RecO (recombination protein O)